MAYSASEPIVAHLLRILAHLSTGQSAAALFSHLVEVPAAQRALTGVELTAEQHRFPSGVTEFPPQQRRVEAFKLTGLMSLRSQLQMLLSIVPGSAMGL